MTEPRTPPPPARPASSRLARPYRTPGRPASATHRLLDELSWEGNARRYRGGGHHLENVLTAEVFGNLDLLPRPWFLAAVLTAATGADDARASIAKDVDHMSVEVLPGDLRPAWTEGTPTGWKIQPDVLLDSAQSFAYIEAKAARGGRFQAAQIARSLLATLDYAHDRTALLLLVTEDPPPLPVQRHGRLDLPEALELGLGNVPEEDAQRLRDALTDTAAWITWERISEVVTDALAQLPSLDPPVRGTIDRAANRILDAISSASGS